MRCEEGLSASVLGSMGVRISKTLSRYRTHLFLPVTPRCISATIGRMHYPALRPDLGQGDWKGFYLRVPRVVCRVSKFTATSASWSATNVAVVLIRVTILTYLVRCALLIVSRPRYRKGSRCIGQRNRNFPRQLSWYVALLPGDSGGSGAFVRSRCETMEEED